MEKRKGTRFDGEVILRVGVKALEILFYFTCSCPSLSARIETGTVDSIKTKTSFQTVLVLIVLVLIALMILLLSIHCLLY